MFSRSANKAISRIAAADAGDSYRVYAHGRKQFNFPFEDLSDAAVRDSLRRLVPDGVFDEIVPLRPTKTLFQLTELRSGRDLVKIGPEPRPFPTIKSFDFEEGVWL